MDTPVVLSYHQAERLLAARREGRRSAHLSLDLGLSECKVSIGAEDVQFPADQMLRWEDVATIARSQRSCFLLENGVLHKIQRFSAQTNRLISLLPTRRAPALMISGILMHRVKDIDPYQDTVTKVRTIAPVTGRVLDTTTGLGYTAIEAAKTADAVVTFELDPAVIAVARCNPWSRALFEQPKITQLLGDSAAEVPRLGDETFARIVHDPPTFDLAGELYSRAFYQQLFRVLQRGGRLFHYIGDLDSKSGSRVVQGVMRRLEEAGFRRVVPQAESFGVVAYK